MHVSSDYLKACMTQTCTMHISMILIPLKHDAHIYPMLRQILRQKFGFAKQRKSSAAAVKYTVQKWYNALQWCKWATVQCSPWYQSMCASPALCCIGLAFCLQAMLYNNIMILRQKFGFANSVNHQQQQQP